MLCSLEEVTRRPASSQKQKRRTRGRQEMGEKVDNVDTVGEGGKVLRRAALQRRVV
jgi:hypothetical protein